MTACETRIVSNGCASHAEELCGHASESSKTTRASCGAFRSRCTAPTNGCILVRTREHP